MSKRKRIWPPIPEPLAGEVVDNHTHLPLQESDIFADDTGYAMPLAEQMERARQVGVTKIVSSACALPEFAPALALAKQWENVRIAVAIHPNEAPLHAGIEAEAPDGITYRREPHHIPLDEALAQVAEVIADPAASDSVVAVGESGLDYFRTSEAGKAAQQESFCAHLKLAADRGLPLQIHDRDAHADTLGVLQREATHDQVIVFHSYSGDRQMAGELVENGWYASFSGPLSYPANEHLREALLALPRSLVLVETDAPYLPPQKYRGCPNASYVMAHTVRTIAEIWGLDEAQTCQILLENSERVYGKW